MPVIPSSRSGARGPGCGTGTAKNISILWPAWRCAIWGIATRLLRGGLHRVPLEMPGGRKLAQLVAHHVLGDVHRDELLAVVHRQRVTHELRNHRRSARPGLDDLFLRPAVHHLDLLEQRGVDERTLL